MPTAHTLAAVPAPVRIFGQQLHPFSPGHYTLLDALDNAFVSSETRTVTQGDLIQGILICCKTFAEGVVLISDVDSMIAETDQLGSIVGRAMAKDGFDFGEAISERAKLFADYVETATQEPKYWMQNSAGPKGGLGWFASMKLSLIGELGYSQAEFWDAPLAQCIADYLGLMEQEGVIRLMTPMELAIIAASKEAANVA